MLDPLGVRVSTALAVSRARRVRIQQPALQQLADTLAGQQITPPAWDARYHLNAAGADLIQYLTIVDTANFCFWGEPRWTIDYRGETLNGYWALAAALTRAVDEGVPLLDAAYLASLSGDQLERILAGSAPIPLIDLRLANLRELGTVLRDQYGGQATNLVSAADGSAVALVQRLVRDLPSYNDMATYAGQTVRFYKRAQLLASDLAAAGAVPPWPDAGQLTAFADYQLPRVLRANGVLVYTPDLADMVDRQVELPAGSTPEVEIRAATVQAVDQLSAALAARGTRITPAGLDNVLWTLAQESLANAKPYHRTRTMFY